MPEETKKLSDTLFEELRQSGMWVVAFIGVCVMVGLGKLKPETVEFMLFAMLGKGISKPAPKDPDA